MYCASAVPVLAFCPNHCQQQALGQEVKSGPWDFLILEWEKRKTLEMPEMEGELLLCVYMTCMLLTSDYNCDITWKCNIGIQVCSSPSSPGLLQYFVTLLCCILGHAKLWGPCGRERVTSVRYNASDNGALAAVWPWGLPVTEMTGGNSSTLVECRISHVWDCLIFASLFEGLHLCLLSMQLLSLHLHQLPITFTPLFYSSVLTPWLILPFSQDTVPHSLHLSFWTSLTSLFCWLGLQIKVR